MLLSELLDGIYHKPLPPHVVGRQVEMISCDSREYQPNGLFVALPGLKYDGNSFVPAAIEKGAWVIASSTSKALDLKEDIVVLDVENPREFLKQVTLRFYDDPSKKVKAIGVTGTNGKTTITYVLESMIQLAGFKSGVIGTVNYRIGQEIVPSTNTTPGLVDLQRFLARLASRKIDYCVMETSSHALKQGRVEGIDYRVAVFTNLTQDHLDYHPDMEDYFQSKAILFKGLSPRSTAVINTDDGYGQRLTALTKARVISFGMEANADVRAQDIQYGLKGTRLTVSYPQGAIVINTPLVGKHNVYNILASFAVGLAEGFAVDRIVRGIEGLATIPGRLEAVDEGQDFFIFIDYAHTEDGLINVLTALRTVSNNKLIVLFGCGGDRDRGKRPKMGAAVCRYADYAIVTSDNPRSEEPKAIINEILAGFSQKNYEVVEDRRDAIARALSLAKSGEIVLLAGKGHEDYQILKDRTVPFNERVIVRDILRR